MGEAMDTNHSGKISKVEFGTELLRGAPSSGVESREHAIDEMFDVGDIDGDGFLEFNEFVSMCFPWSSMDEAVLERYVGELLADMSQNSEPSITQEELEHFFGGYHLDGTLFLRIDTHGTGRVDAKAVRGFLLRFGEIAGKALDCEVKLLGPIDVGC